MYTITTSDIQAAKQYAIDKSRGDSGFSWDNTIFAGVKSNSNQFTVGDFGEKLAEIVLNVTKILPTPVSIDKQADADLIDAAGKFHEVKTAFNAPEFYKIKSKAGQRKPAKFFCNQIRFETVADKSVSKSWNKLIFVLCDGVKIEMWTADNSEALKNSLGKNNDSSWTGSFADLESNTLWTKIAEGTV